MAIAREVKAVEISMSSVIRVMILAMLLLQRWICWSYAGNRTKSLESWRRASSGHQTVVFLRCREARLVRMMEERHALMEWRVL